MANEGKKFDQDKPKLSYLPYEALLGAAKVFEFGAAKYGKHNYKAGMDWSRPWDAAQRHLQAWWDGESHDPESGRSHLDHALCNLMMLKFYEERKVGTDDRYTTQQD
jgi:hypothetical protein